MTDTRRSVFHVCGVPGLDLNRPGLSLTFRAGSAQVRTAGYEQSPKTRLLSESEIHRTGSSE